MRLTTNLLQRAAKASERACAYQSSLTEAFVERYGVTYSDVDCEALIDTLDYGGGDISLAECDRHMTECGHPPLARTHTEERNRDD